MTSPYEMSDSTRSTLKETWYDIYDNVILCYGNIGYTVNTLLQHYKDNEETTRLIRQLSEQVNEVRYNIGDVCLNLEHIDREVAKNQRMFELEIEHILMTLKGLGFTQIEIEDTLYDLENDLVANGTHTDLLDYLKKSINHAIYMAEQAQDEIVEIL